MAKVRRFATSASSTGLPDVPGSSVVVVIEVNVLSRIRSKISECCERLDNVQSGPLVRSGNDRLQIEQDLVQPRLEHPRDGVFRLPGVVAK